MHPLIDVDERLGENVAGLPISAGVHELKVIAVELLVEPVHRDAVRALQMAHCWVATSFSNAQHDRIVLVEDELRGTADKPIPEVHEGKALVADSEVGGDHFRLGGAVGRAALTLAHAIQRKTR